MTPTFARRAPFVAVAVGSALTLASACSGAFGGGDGGGKRFDHAQAFVVTGSHQGFSCDKCHDPTKDSYALAGGGVSCGQCHADADTTPGHTGVAGYAYADASCIACHKDGKTAVFDHTKNFPIAQGTPHQNIACSDCHGPTRAVADLRCITCHTHDQATTDAAHASVSGYAYASPSCYGCHKDGTAGLPPDHDTAKFPITGTKHATVGCSQCHGATKAVADVTCVPCHAQPATDSAHVNVQKLVEGIQNYQYASPACLRCHADGQVNTIASHPRNDSGLGKHQPWCINCHDLMRTDKPWGADFSRTDQTNCDACHTARNAGPGH